jgi:hypothetical protein
LAEQAEAECRLVEAELLRDLGRPPSGADKIAIETIAATVIRARRLRADGRSDAEERKLVAQLMRATGLRPASPVPQKATPQSLEEWWRTASAGEGGEP